MPTFQKATTIDKIPEGTAKCVSLCEKSIAIFNLEGRFFAINNICPHRGASLASGAIDGRKVICPWHGWEFDIPTGHMWTGEGVESYPVKIEEDQIWIEV